MNRIICVMLLDFRSMPVISKILLAALILLIFKVSVAFTEFPLNKALPGSIAIWLLIVIMHPFVLVENNRLKRLHAALPLTRGDIVKARYLCIACILAVASLPHLLLKPLFFPENDSLAAGAFLAASFFTVLLYPPVFKFENRTLAGRSISFIFIFCFIVGYSPVSGLFNLYLWLIPATLPGKLAAWLILLCLSYLLSLKLYAKRDL